MTLRKIPSRTVSLLRKSLRRKIWHEDYDDLVDSVVYINGLQPWVWEVTVTHSLLVTIRQVDRKRIDTLDEDIVNGGAIYNGYAKSCSPKDLEEAIRRVRKTQCQEVSL